MTVIGAGFIGAEVASAAASRGMEATMINNAPVPFTAQLGQDMGDVVAKLHRANGVNLICGAVIEEFHTGEGVISGLTLADGRHLETDVVVVGIGAESNTEWLEGSGVELGSGVLCDAMGRTNVPGIVAVGDCAAWFDKARGGHRRVGSIGREPWSARRWPFRPSWTAMLRSSRRSRRISGLTSTASRSSSPVIPLATTVWK